MSGPIKLTAAQAELLEKQGVDLQIKGYLDLKVNAKAAELQDQYARNEKRKSPLPPAHMSICLSCPSCGRLFHHKGPISTYIEMVGQAKAEVLIHLTQDHQWKEDKIRRWNDWFSGTSGDDDEKKKELPGGDSNLDWW